MKRKIINLENWDDCTQVSDEFKLGVKQGRQEARKELIEILNEEMKIDEDMHTLKKHIEIIKYGILNKLKSKNEVK